jgi:hypothetical protein
MTTGPAGSARADETASLGDPSLTIPETRVEPLPVPTLTVDDAMVRC